MNRRLWLLNSLIFGLLLLGLITLQGNVLLLAIPLIIFIGFGLLYGPESIQLSVQRSFSAQTVVPDVPVEVQVRVVNQGRLAEEIYIEDNLPPSLKVVEGQTRRLTQLPPGMTAELKYKVQGKRGVHMFTSTSVMVSDQLGLFIRRQTLSTPDKFTVLPKPQHLRSIAIRPLRTQVYTGPIPSRRGGSGVNYFDVREYQPGDPLRRVNWRITARHASDTQDLFTNEYEQERIADVGLILDARQQSDFFSKWGGIFEHSVEATAGLAEAFLGDGHRVGLLIYGRGQETTFPGYGKVQRERIFQALARARTGANLALENLSYLPTRFFPPHSQIVLISPLLKDDLTTLIRLPALGYRLLVVSPDPISFEARAIHQLAVNDRHPEKILPGLELATRIARVERMLLLRKLHRAGILVVNWPVDKSLDKILHATLSRMPATPRR